MSKVKCAFCHKEIDKKEAYAVPQGKRNRYFCSKEHYESILDRDYFYQRAERVFGKTTNALFYKEFDFIASIHGFKKMTAYLNENEQKLINVMNKSFKSEYGRIKYFATVFKNSLGDFYYKDISNDDKNQIIESVEIYDSNYKRIKQREGMESLLSDLVDSL